MGKLFSSVVSFFLSFVTVFIGDVNLFINPVQYTPLESREYKDGEIIVAPDPSKHINVTVTDEGYDVFTPSGSGQYAYGPSIFVNADGSIDLWTARPGDNGEWDWIEYRHSPDGGKSWTNEKRVLYPTPGSADAFSTCDPGVVKFGGYYYIGYTSTTDARGTDNCVYVARSRTPDGFFEKWNGSGWGGDPSPIVVFDGNRDEFGAGEPSFVDIGDVLYIYYAWCDGGIRQTRVAVADAADENWPATMEYKGVAITSSGADDSADVKFVDDFGKFIAVTTSDRFTENSYISVYESDDGFAFTKCDALKTSIAVACHNCGISSRPNGHIRLCDENFIGYAYGTEWGCWPTRINKISVSLSDAPDLSDTANENLKLAMPLRPGHVLPVYIAFSTREGCYTVKSGCSLAVRFHMTTTEKKEIPVFFPFSAKIKYSDYDETVVSFSGGRCRALKAGETLVVAEYLGHTAVFRVKVL